jgi:hypothetical protein
MDPSHKTMCPDNKERDNLTLWKGALEGLYEFRYPDGLDELDAVGEKYSNYLIKGWYDFVYWMAHSNP